MKYTKNEWPPTTTTTTTTSTTTTTTKQQKQNYTGACSRRRRISYGSQQWRWLAVFTHISVIHQQLFSMQNIEETSCASYQDGWWFRRSFCIQLHSTTPFYTFYTASPTTGLFYTFKHVDALLAVFEKYNKSKFQVVRNTARSFWRNTIGRAGERRSESKLNARIVVQMSGLWFR